MKIAIVVSSITKGSGLTKYVCSLLNIMSSISDDILVITTHGINPEDEKATLSEYGECRYVGIAKCNKLYKYIKLATLLRSFAPDVLFVNYNGVTQFILPTLPKYIKKIHILHNDTTDFYRIGAINANYVSGWIAPTQGIADNFNKYTNNKYSDRVSVISHGVEDNSNPIHQAVNTLELVFVGVLYEHKGAHLLPRIIEKLRANGLNFHFTIIGGGKLDNSLRTELNDEIESGVVTMTGVISPKEVYDVLSNSDIFIYPTHVDAFGLVIAEAMVSGVVPIVSRLSGITDNLVDDTECGYLIEVDDIDAFVDKTVYLAENRNILDQMKLLARAKARTHFSLDTMRVNYINYLKRLE